MKMEMGGSGEARDFQEEAFGVMMDPKGIVLGSLLEVARMLA